MKAMTSQERLARARTSFLMGEYEMAERLLEKIVLEKPHLPNVYNILGSVYERKGKYKDAIKAFHKAIELRPDNGEAYNNLGVAYKNSGDTDKAYSILQKALHVTRSKVDIYYNLGNLYRDKGEYEHALQHYRQALTLDPGYILAYNNMGTVLEKLGRFDEAVRAYRQGLQVDINHPRLHYNLGVIFKRKGLYKQAKDEFEYALRINHGWTQAMNNLGLVYQELGEPERALSIFQDVLKTEPQNTEVHNNIGVLLQKQKQFDKADKAFRTAIQHNPDYGLAHFNLSLLLAENGYHKEALEQLQKIKTHDPHDLQIPFRKGFVLTVLGRFNEAERCFHEVLEKDPSSADALAALVNVYLKQGNIQNAYDMQKRLTGLGHSNPEFHLELAFIRKDRGEYKNAEEEIKRYLEKCPGDENAQVLLADLCYKQGNLRYAQAVLSALIRGGSSHEEAYYLLARVYRESGDYKRAVAVLKEIVEKHGASEAVADMDKLNESLKLYEETINEYEKEYEEQWQKNLIKYRDFSEEIEKQQAVEEDAFLFNEELAEEQAVPIIRVGGMEPVLAVREEQEELTLEESEEVLPEAEQHRVIEIREENAPSLMNLLEGQELYREAPFAQHIPRPYPAASPLPGYDVPETTPPSPAFTNGAAEDHGPVAERSYERPQERTAAYENELKNLTHELRRAVDAAGKAVQKNMSDMQAATGSAVPSPTAPPVIPQYIFVPQTPLPLEITSRGPEKQEADRPEGSEDENRAEAGASELVEEKAEAGPPRPEEEESAAGSSQAEEEKEEPEIELLEQEDEAFTEQAGEPDDMKFEDQDTVRVEQSEETVGEKNTEVEHPDFFSQKPRIQNKQPAKLLDYLANMANYLPQDEQFNLWEKDMHLKIQNLRAKISGHRGLMSRIKERFRDRIRTDEFPLTTDTITSAFSFIKTLSSYVPNRETGSVLALKIDSIIEKMRSV